MERRKHPRYSTILRAVRDGEDTQVFTPSWLAAVPNISRGGLALHAGERFETGTRLTLSLYCEKHHLGPLEVRILHSTEQENGTWMMGGEFLVELSEECLQSVLLKEEQV